MKFSAFISAAVLLAACSQPAKKAAEIPAKSMEKASVVTTDEPSAQPKNATCKRGLMDEERTFIHCADGELRKAGVLLALSAPHDPDLKIEGVAAQYAIPPQVFTGIQSATYSSLVSKEGKSIRQGKHKPREGLVQIEDKIYDVYQVSIGDQTGTVFVERLNAE